MFERRKKKQLNHERYNSLITSNSTYRPLFQDVETFDDLYARNTDIELEKEQVVSTERIIKKPSKMTIIEPTFENFLHQATIEQKQIYNDVKNIMLSYKNISSSIEKESEIYQINNQKLFEVSFVGNYIQIKYLRITFNIDAMIKVKMFEDEIYKLMKENNIEKIENYQKVDFVEKFPQLENCIIMDEEIVGNLPFKVFNK